MTESMHDSTVLSNVEPDAGPAAGNSGTRRRPVRRFLRHFAEMALAMLVGMLLLGPLWEVFTGALGVRGVFDRADVDALVMATNMTLGMSIWMRHRGHRWRPVAEMGTAMYVPFLLFLPPFWLGAVTGEVLLMAGHTLMLPAMLLAMLLRPDEYTGQHARPGQHADTETDTDGGVPNAPPAVTGAAGRTSRRIVSMLKHRWPTWLALLVTIDSWTDPVVIDPRVMLILPLGYLAIGAVRRQFGNPRVLALQLGGVVGYLALTAAAMNASDDLSRYLIGAGWLAHSVWDFAHHRADKVVPRGYSECCGVLDAVIGISIIFLV